MAKAKKFPSAANTKPGASAKANAKKEPKAQEKTVEGKSQKLVSVHYTKDNHHILDGVHALRKGNNSIPKEAFAEHMKHPAVQKLIKDGHIILNAEDFELEESDIEETDGEGQDGDDTGTDEPGATPDPTGS